MLWFCTINRQLLQCFLLFFMGLKHLHRNTMIITSDNGLLGDTNHDDPGLSSLWEPARLNSESISTCPHFFQVLESLKYGEHSYWIASSSPASLPGTAPPLQRSHRPHSATVLSTWFSCCIATSNKLCILGDISELEMEATTLHIVLTALSIAKKTVLMNWKFKNNLRVTQYKMYFYITSGKNLGLF